MFENLDNLQVGHECIGVFFPFIVQLTTADTPHHTKEEQKSFKSK